jgi:hypothetical protein
MMMEANKYTELRKLDVSKQIEKKNGLSYLSWAWAVDVLLQNDPTATWEYKEPMRFGDSIMVFCSVTAFGKTMTAQLPVMDHRNKAIPNPDAFEVNKAMQRCLAKAIALHGIGLYIYAGEDLPEPTKATVGEKVLAGHMAAIESAANVEALKTAFTAAYKAAEILHDSHAMALFTDAKDARKAALTTTVGAN